MNLQSDNADTDRRERKMLAGLLVRSSMIAGLVKDQRLQSEPVAKQLLGNPVQGCQTTITETRLKFIPDPARIHAELVSKGNITSRTETRNPQALIQSAGHHQFEITKPVYFDGQRLLTQPGYGVIQVSQSPVRVMSSLTAVPLLGAAADQVAWSEVMRRQPEIERALAEDLSREVIPKVDREIDQELATFSLQIQRLSKHLTTSLGTLPQQLSVDTTTKALRFRLQSEVVLSQPGRDGDRKTDWELDTTEDVVFLLDEHFVTSAINRMIPANTVIPDSQLVSLQNALQSLQDGKPWSQFRAEGIQQFKHHESSDASLFSIQLADEQPFSILFLQGVVAVRMKCQIIPKFGNPSQWLHLETRWKGQGVDADYWSIKDCGVDVTEHQTRQMHSPNQQIPTGSISTPLNLLIPQAASTSSEHLTSGETPSTADPTARQDNLSTQTTGSLNWIRLVKTTASSLISSLPAVRLPRSIAVPEVLKFLLASQDPVDAAGMQSILNSNVQLHRIQCQNGQLRVSFRLIQPQ